MSGWGPIVRVSTCLLYRPGPPVTSLPSPLVRSRLGQIPDSDMITIRSDAIRYVRFDLPSPLLCGVYCACCIQYAKCTSYAFAFPEKKRSKRQGVKKRQPALRVVRAFVVRRVVRRGRRDSRTNDTQCLHRGKIYKFMSHGNGYKWQVAVTGPRGAP